LLSDNREPADPTTLAARTPDPDLNATRAFRTDHESTLDRTLLLSSSRLAGDSMAYLGNDPVERKFSRVATLIVAGQKVAALAACCELESWLAREPALADLKTRAEELTTGVKRDLLVADGLELIGTATRIRPVAGQHVLIGRPSSSRSVEIAISCRWFSRGERSLCVFSKGDNWFIEDLGSANGMYIGDKKLEKSEARPLPAGESIIEVGRSLQAVAPVIVSLTRADPAIVIQVQPGGAFKDPDLKTWPTLHDDLTKRWLVFPQSCRLSADESRIVARKNEDAVAQLSFDNGFWIAPLGGRDLRIDGMTFRDRVPLPAAVDLEVGGLRFRTERLPSAMESRSNHG
jgi:hypothetical protein